MKNIIIISFVFFLSLPILSANAGGKRPIKPCPDAATEGTEIPQRCVGITVACPSVAIQGSRLSTRCTGASGLTKVCPLYSNNPPPACRFISQPSAVLASLVARCEKEGGDWINKACHLKKSLVARCEKEGGDWINKACHLKNLNLSSPVSTDGGSIDGMSGSTDSVAPDYPADPTLNLIGPINPLPDDGRVGGDGMGTGVSPEYCSINKGAKRCTSCSNSNSYSPQYPENTGSYAKEKKEQCTSCSITTERLVPRIGCDSNADCTLVRGDCCDGCSTIAINKSQKSKYFSLLNNACNPPLKEGELGGKGSCGCGYSHGRPIYKAVCRETNWKIPSSLTTCQVSTAIYYQPSVGGTTVGGGATGSSVQ